MKISLALVVIILILQAFATPCLATESTEEIDPEIQKLANELESARKSIVEDEVRSREVMSSLFEINRKMKKLVSDKAQLEQERFHLESQTKILAARLIALEDKVKNQKVLMRERLSAIYKLGGQGLARILFSSTNSAQLERNLKILGVVAKRDLDLIKEYARNVKDLEVRRKKFTQRLAHLKKLETNIRQKEVILSQQNASKSMILSSIKKSKSFNVKKLSQLRSQSSELASSDDSGLYDLLLRPSFFEQKGKLPWPAKGEIKQSYGLIKDNQSSVVIPHKGIFLQTKDRAPVRPIFSGKVVWTGSLPDFGPTLIIDHGDHYYSVYSSLENIEVHLGQEVTPNQAMARVSLQNENHLPGIYFEIRHFSEPTNPLLWVKADQPKDVL